jgi:hypothetical protein
MKYRLAFVVGLAFAGWAAADWTTFGGDPNRTGLAGPDSAFNRQSAKRLKPLWSATLDSFPIELTSATAPVVASGEAASGVVIAGAGDDRLYGLDASSGKIRWSHRFDVQGTPMNRGAGGWLCPNAMQATPVIDPANHAVYAVSRDGRLRMLDLSTGEERHPAVQFTPPFSKSWSLNLVDGVIYTATSQNCNRAENGVWAIRVKDAAWPVMHWRSAGGIWGSAGVTAGPDGRIFAALGDGDPATGLASGVVALKPGTLELSDYFRPPNADSINRRDLDMGSLSPLVFRFREWTLAAAAGKEGRIYLLNTDSLGGADYRTALFQSPLYANEDEDFAGRGFWGSMSTWEDSRAVRWLLAPAWGPQHSGSPAFPLTHGDAPDGSLMAFQVRIQDEKPVLTPAWRSRNMKMPAPAAITGEVIFALESGEDAQQVDSGGSMLTSKLRAQMSTHAVLYALDAATGEELWSSVEAIRGFSRFSGPAVSGGRVFVTAGDAKNPPALYAFGAPTE